MYKFIYVLPKTQERKREREKKPARTQTMDKASRMPYVTTQRN